MYPDVSKCIQTYLMCPERSYETPGVKCIRMYPNVSECIRMYPNLSVCGLNVFKPIQMSKCIQMYPNVFSCIQMSNRIQLVPAPTEFQGLPRSNSIQMYPSVSKCIHLYPVRGTMKAGVTIPSALKTKVTAKPGRNTDESERS